MTAIFFFGLLPGSQAQTLKIDSLSGKYVMRDIIPVDTTLTREQIFGICKDWVVRNLKSSDNNILLDDKDYKQITTTGVVKTSDMPIALCSIANCMIDFKFTINIKEGRIRYTIENIVHYGTNSCSNPPERMTTPLEKWNLKVKLGKNVFADIEAKLTALTKDLALSFSRNDKDNW